MRQRSDSVGFSAAKAESRLSWSGPAGASTRSMLGFTGSLSKVLEAPIPGRSKSSGIFAAAAQGRVIGIGGRGRSIGTAISVTLSVAPLISGGGAWSAAAAGRFSPSPGAGWSTAGDGMC